MILVVEVYIKLYRSIACYVDAPGVDITNCGGGIVFDRVEDAINHRDELRDVDIGVVVKTSRELDRVGLGFKS